MAPPVEPERMCIGCRRRAPKGSLIRLVRSPQGRVNVDPDGDAPGRGAYVHRNRSCAVLAIERGAAGRALRTALQADELDNLRMEIERILD